MHCAFPVSFWNWPAGHTAHFTPLFWNFPGTQLKQEIEPGFGVYVPRSQEMHCAFPVSFWNWPRAQDWHPLLFWYLPGGQFKQKFWSDTWPNSHGKHMGTVVLLNLKPGLHV
jgi:hypothetical protein